MRLVLRQLSRVRGQLSAFGVRLGVHSLRGDGVEGLIDGWSGVAGV